MSTNVGCTPNRRDGGQVPFAFPETCPACGGALRIIACIQDPAVIKKILTHLDTKDASTAPARLPPSRGTPHARLFD